MHTKMERTQWEFSEQAQPELNKFLMAVKNSKRNIDLKTHKLWQQIHPLCNQSEPLNQIDVKTVRDDEIIIIDDDEKMPLKTEVNKTLNDCGENLPDLSVIHLTIIEPEPKVCHPDLQDFIEYIEETLKIEEGSLLDDDIKKLSIYDDFNLDILFKSVNDSMTHQGIFNFGQSICSHSNADNITRIAKHFCVVLLNKLKNSNPTLLLKSLLKDFTNTYPEETRREVLIPLFKSKKCHPTVFNIVTDSEKQYFLRDFLFSCSELEVWQLTILQSLITSETENSVKHRLINLLEMSADKFNSEKLFLKLVITLINNMGEGFEDINHIEEKLFNIIDKNKTILKSSAHKALNEWLENYNIG